MESDKMVTDNALEVQQETNDIASRISLSGTPAFDGEFNSNNNNNNATTDNSNNNNSTNNNNSNNNNNNNNEGIVDNAEGIVDNTIILSAVCIASDTAGDESLQINRSIEVQVMTDNVPQEFLEWDLDMEMEMGQSISSHNSTNDLASLIPTATSSHTGPNLASTNNAIDIEERKSDINPDAVNTNQVQSNHESVPLLNDSTELQLSDSDDEKSPTLDINAASGMEVVVETGLPLNPSLPLIPRNPSVKRPRITYEEKDKLKVGVEKYYSVTRARLFREGRLINLPTALVKLLREDPEYADIMRDRNTQSLKNIVANFISKDQEERPTVMPTAAPLVSARSTEPSRVSPTSVGQDSVTSNTYCICKKPAYGKMICCANVSCPIGMYHLSCINMTSDPDDSWRCKYCAPDTQQKKNSTIVTQPSNPNPGSPAVVSLNLGILDCWEDVGETERRLLEKEFTVAQEPVDSVHQGNMYFKFKDWKQVHNEVLEAKLNEDLPNIVNENVLLQLLKRFPPR